MTLVIYIGVIRPKAARRRLDSLFAKTSGIPDMETQAHWARYLCVLVSGYIEVSLREILSEYTRARATPPVLNYVENQLGRFQNPNIERIIQLVGHFSQELAKRIDIFDSVTKDAVNSVSANSHGIAHGRNVGIRIAAISAYYFEAKKLIQIICDEL